METSRARIDRRGWGYRAAVYSAIASALGYLAFSLWSGWQEVAKALFQVGFGGLVFALSMSLLNYGLRFLRWQAYLHALGHPLAWRPSLQIYLAGFALSTTPGKVGEAIRSTLLKHHGMPYSRSLAAFVSERLSDLLAISGLAAIGLTHYAQAKPFALLGLGLTLTGLLLLSQHGLLCHLLTRSTQYQGRLMALLRQALTILLNARSCHRPNLIVTASLLSLVAWSAEALAFHCLLHWMGMEEPLSFSIFVYAVAVLAGVISLMPGGLGGAEATMIALLMGNGMPSADAVAATLLIRIATLWFAVAIGVVALARVATPSKPLMPTD